MQSDVFIKLLVQFGFPTCFAIAFCYWFFIRHIPALREETQQRFVEIREDYNQALRSQERAMERQGDLFKAALDQIVNRMSDGFKELHESIERLQNLSVVTQLPDGFKELKAAIERLQERFQIGERRKKTEEDIIDK